MAEMTIRRFGVVSVGKMYGLLMFIMGLIIGVIYGLIFIVLGATTTLGLGRDATAAGVSSVVIGIVMMIGIPLMYGFLGLVVGMIMALIYNGVAGVIGGIKLELEGAQQEYLAPPHHWEPHQYPAQ
jgi:hypothetical protein